MILQLYDRLLEHAYNPVVALNRCLVLAELEGPEKAIEALKNVEEISQTSYYKTSAGELYLKTGDKARAKQFFSEAQAKTTSLAETELIQRKLKLCDEE
jgi:RNA polymerase sigma-70 factor (ECF subfamily)